MIFTNAGTTSMTVSNNGRPMNHTTKLTFFFSFLESTVLTIADWYHAVSSKVPIPAVADSTLINGLGRYPGGPASPLAVVNVIRGSRYRMRLVSMACDAFYTFSIDGHNMTIIEADGVSTSPLVVNNITIYAAQRYSFILNANQKVGNYWIRAEPRAGADGGPQGYTGGINSAILRYSGAPAQDPTTTITPVNKVIPLQEGNLRSLALPVGKPRSGGADVYINLELGFNASKPQFFVNNASFIPPKIPVLLQILSGTTSPQDLLPQGDVIALPPNKVIEVSIPPGAAVGNPVSNTLPQTIIGFCTNRDCKLSASFPLAWGQ